jgi:hypothetical protein
VPSHTSGDLGWKVSWAKREKGLKKKIKNFFFLEYIFVKRITQK